jgi:ankyrin repeat protein
VPVLRAGHLDAMQVLLDAGARATAKCEGSPALHMAACVGSHPEHAAFAPLAVELLMQHGVVPYDRDDHGRTALHWAAAYGLPAVAEPLLAAAARFAAEQPPAGAADGEDAPLPALTELADKQGNTPLHLAARQRHGAVLRLLLAQRGGPAPAAAVKQRNKAGLSALHMAALGGDADCVQALLEAAPSAAATATTRQGLTPAALAAKRGHAAAAALLQGGGPAAAPAPASPRHHAHPGRTLVLAPPECLEHHTAPWPFVRGGADPPPENVNRLVVLTRPGTGVLRTSEFAGAAALRWDERPRRAALGDVLRVHDWAYVRKIQAACAQVPASPGSIGHLDGDTAISHATFAAALGAAGATCHAVDEVVAGRARNAFCAVRPPGHHAGPGGVVTSANDPNGSHGFCLFNNVAVGAAYALTVHRHAGVKRVALLDFDVHHGNGTEACVANTAPSLAKYAFSTPFGEGVQQFPVYKPWHDADDRDNVFFARCAGGGSGAGGGGEGRGGERQRTRGGERQR